MATVPTSTRPPFWRDVRVLRVLAQIAFLVAVALVMREIWLNLEYNYGQQGVSTNWDFLKTRAGFGINVSLNDYNPNKTYLDAFFAGLLNTIFLIALPGIIMASILGLIIGIGRLSKNWIVRKISQVYVELLRNVPVLVIIVIMYVGVILPLPALSGGLHIPGLGFLSNRGAAVTYLKPQDGFSLWLLFLVLGGVAWFLIRRSRKAIEDERGTPAYPNVLGALGLIAIAGVGAAFLSPLDLEIPSLPEGAHNYVGGLQAGPELAAVLIGLVLYTSAFIAEIIRGSIQAVSKGQKEAAEALGLRPGQQLRLVILPQALRVALPPINSQYLNLMKNSSLAIAVGFQELAGVSKTMTNQSGRSFQVLLMVLGTFLALSLVISSLMNLVNRSVARRGAARA